jgi:hypothetical protein
MVDDPEVTTRPPTEVLHIDDSVSEDVHDFCLASTHNPLALRPVEMDVPVQPQGGLVTVYEAQERREADVGWVLVVAEPEGRGVADKDARFRPSGEFAAQDARRERPGPAAH